MTTNFTNGYSLFVPEYWSTKLNTKLQKSCVMLQCVNRNYEGEIKNSGDTVNILTPGDVTVSTYTGSSLTYQETTPVNSQLVIDQRKFFTFRVNDIATAQSNTNIIDAYLESAKNAIEVAQDSYLLSKHADVAAGNTMGGTTAISLTTTNIYEQFVELAKILKNANALSNGQKPWVVINPDVEAILLQCEQFTSAYQIADKTLRDGSIGRVAGLDVLVSTNLQAVSDNINILAGTNDAITFASQVANIETIRDKDSFSDLVRGLYLYGAKTVNAGSLAKMVATID